ncbi:MAG TPA: peptidoglycan-binding protein [Ilumatobacteraceae bacterium]|nr:peptidoglycan-binding protein [Ilumatobacteraceae bacterium]
MGNRRYTGFDGNAPGKRAGLERLVELTVDRSGGGVWNNGTWGARNSKGPPGATPRPSVHGTGRAADMSWRRVGDKGLGAYESALQVVEFWIANAELFLIEEIHDYFPPPHGRGWRCDRSAWRMYKKPTIGSAPGGDWFHVEIAPTHADDAAYYEQAFASLPDPFGGAPVADPGPPADPGRPPDPGYVAPVPPPGSPQLSVAFSGAARADVKALQEILISQGWADFSKADGRFGNRTMGAVKAMQTALGFTGNGVDGKYGPRTAGKLRDWLATRH